MATGGGDESLPPCICCGAKEPCFAPVPITKPTKCFSCYVTMENGSVAMKPHDSILANSKSMKPGFVVCDKCHKLSLKIALAMREMEEKNKNK